MKLVLDTHVWIWSFLNPDGMTEAARSAIRYSDSISICAASIYELEYKVRLGRWPQLSPALVDTMVDESDTVGIEIVAPDAVILSSAARLDWPHGDPFDRMIVAMARNRRATLVTRDRVIHDQDFVDTLQA